MVAGRGRRSWSDRSRTARVVAEPLSVQRFVLVGIEGPLRGRAWSSRSDRCSIGSHPSNDLVVDDATVSRFHCEIVLGAQGARLRDAGSTNGVVVDGVSVLEAILRSGQHVRLGESLFRFELEHERNAVPLSEQTELGGMVGISAAMRAVFAQIERAAVGDATVLLEGETGTGKGEAAEALHARSARGAGPFVVVDCAAMPPALLESELYGHERGAFTGADRSRTGAFEQARGGTVFLDEIGELPLDLQPKLLRVLDARTVKPLGGAMSRPVDVRVVAATNRDLRAEVNAGRFRPDLFYRLAVVRIVMPPLRERPEDLPAIARRVLASLGADERTVDALCDPPLLARLAGASWPGNVRELRNYLERCLVFRSQRPDEPLAHPPTGVDAREPYAAARERAIAEFERRYVAALLHLHGGDVQRAAQSAGVNRAYLYRLVSRHGLRAP